ncbi:MAG: M15 family metallopeptidase [Bacteroidota bacterium]
MKKNIILLVIFCFLFNSVIAFSQGRRTVEIPKNNYGLQVVSDIELYKKQVSYNANDELVDLQKFIPGIVLDIKYATADNFVGLPLYSLPKAYLRKPVAEALLRIQEVLKTRNLGLKIFDAYRPYSVTLKFYEKIKDTNFVASPWSGSRHNRGAAVDLTLIDLKDNAELTMPTKFDDFSDKASPTYINLSITVLKNRNLLIQLMQKYGFTVNPNEWWHYDYEGWSKFPVTDIKFEELEKLNK